MNLRTKTATILVVDDDLLNLRLMARTLAGAGFATTVAANGAEAVEWMKTQQFDAVVTGLQMPHLNGIELLQYVPARHPWLPIIFMTGQVEQDMREAASACGAAALLQKPVSRGELIAALRMALADAAPPFAPAFPTEAEAVVIQAV